LAQADSAGALFSLSTCSEREEQKGSARSPLFFSWSLRRSNRNVFIGRIETPFRSPKKIYTVEGYTDLAPMTRCSGYRARCQQPWKFDGSLCFPVHPAE